MRKYSPQAGFSLLELVIVLVVVAILATVSIASFVGNRRYSADEQARMLIDFLDEARQKALNQRKTFRIEINRTQNEIRLIDEGRDASTATDDTILKRKPISGLVVIGAAPPNASGAPTASSPIPVPSYAVSSYPLSNGDSKITLRFKRTGQVVDAGSDSIGTGSLVSGSTIYVYERTPAGKNPDVIRAVAVLGPTGDTSLYKCTFTGTQCGNWSR